MGDEVCALFERYDQALIDDDVEALEDTSWNSPQTIRYAFDGTATASRDIRFLEPE